MPYQQWMRQLARLAQLELDAIYRASDDLEPLFRGGYAPFDAIHHLRRIGVIESQSRNHTLKKTFFPNEAISVAELASALGAHHKDLLDAALAGETFRGATPPKPWISGTIRPAYYFWAVDAHKAYSNVFK